MTSPSDAYLQKMVRLRSRVLYYWAASRCEPVVELAPTAIKCLLELDDWPSQTMNLVIKDLRRGMQVDVLLGGGIRIHAIPDDDIEDIFLHWQIKTGHTRTRMTAARRSKIKARLADGFTVAQLKRACDGLVSSSWHCGENPNKTKYLGLDVVFKSADSVERFISTELQQDDTFDGDDVEAIRNEWKRKRDNRDS